MNRSGRVLRILARKCAVALVVFVGLTSQSWAVPVNDLIENAILIPAGAGTIDGTTIDATVDTGAPRVGSNPAVSVTSLGVWYTIFGSGNPIRLDTFGSATNFDTKISVYSDFTGTLADLTPIGGNDDAPGGCTFCSSFAFGSTAGEQYWILVHGFGSDKGNFGLNYTDTAVVPLPAAFPLFAAALGLLSLLGWRSKRRTAAA